MTKGKKQFLEKLETVKASLPEHYGVFFHHEFPDFCTKRRLHEVVQGNVVDWDILDKLEKIAELYARIDKD